MPKRTVIIAVAAVAAIIIGGGIIYSKAVKPPPPDDATTKLMRFDNVRGQRYTEILPIWGNGLTKKLVAGVYNTLGLNSSTGTGDSSPQELLDKVTVEHYSTAVADSWKEQLLPNIVKPRYGDSPAFLEVASVVARLQPGGSWQTATATKCSANADLAAIVLVIVCICRFLVEQMTAANSKSGPP